jgi:hypothetical protein
VWLPWRPAAILAASLAVVGLSLPRIWRRSSGLAAWVREASLILLLYTIWRFIGAIGTVRADSGLANGRTLYDIERHLHIGNEKAIVDAFLPYPWLVQASNVYYAVAHAPSLFLFLVWMFLRHRDHYRTVRNTIAWVTGICLLLHFIPVAPPRLYPELGFVDTARLYHQSVYTDTIGQGLSDQMSAFPSIHAAWALIVGIGLARFGTTRRRWCGMVHAALTWLVVVNTANHWWLDSIAAAAILGVVMAVQHALRRDSRPVAEEPEREPVAAA